MRILIADDNALVRRGIAAILATVENYFVCGEAADGAEAILKGQELRPDLILVDISMPGISGWETAILLRQKVPNAKIVIISQNDAAVLEVRAEEAGVHGCVDKGQLNSKLLPTIAAILKP